MSVKKAKVAAMMGTGRFPGKTNAAHAAVEAPYTHVLARFNSTDSDTASNSSLHLTDDKSGSNTSSSVSTPLSSRWASTTKMNSVDLIIPEQNTGVEHEFSFKRHSSSIFCNICKEKILFHSLTCRVCQFTIHDTCRDKAPKSCRTCFAEPNKPLQHQWLTRNIGSHATCHVCHKRMRSAGLIDVACMWCGKKSHLLCKDLQRDTCDLGMHGPLVIDPSQVIPLNVAPNELPVISAQRPQDSAHWLVRSSPNKSPVLVFINPASGDTRGPKLFARFKRALNPIQVFDLSKGNPVVCLRLYKNVPNLLVVGCGGDGTVSWILSAVQEAFGLNGPPVAVLPLGTGNDMARVLGWGGVFTGSKIDDFLVKCKLSTTVQMDRWAVEVARLREPLKSKATKTSGETRVTVTEDMPKDEEYKKIFTMNNYFSIGVDAKVSLDFHRRREDLAIAEKKTLAYAFKHPSHFFNPRYRNHIWYTRFGIQEMHDHSCKNLEMDVQLICDGKTIDLPAIEGITVQNIPSYLGGASLWKAEEQKGFNAAQFDDGVLEVFAVMGSWHTGKLKVGMADIYKICQCKEIILKFRVDKAIPVQVDGEPWDQAPCTMRISHLNKAPMLITPHKAQSMDSLSGRDSGWETDSQSVASTASDSDSDTSLDDAPRAKKSGNIRLESRLSELESEWKERENKLNLTIGDLEKANRELQHRCDALELKLRPHT